MNLVEKVKKMVFSGRASIEECRNTRKTSPGFEVDSTGNVRTFGLLPGDTLMINFENEAVLVSDGFIASMENAALRKEVAGLRAAIEELKNASA